MNESVSSESVSTTDLVMILNNKTPVPVYKLEAKKLEIAVQLLPSLLANPNRIADPVEYAFELADEVITLFAQRIEGLP